MIRRVLAAIESLPAPAWLVRELDAHERRRRLVLEIAALGGKPCAWVALWVAWSARLHGGSVEGVLRMFRDNLARGGR